MVREGAAAAARGFETRDREPGPDRPGTGQPGTGQDAGDILRRIAALVGEIDALKRERHATPVLDARAKLAEIYFRKRPGDRET